MLVLEQLNTNISDFWLVIVIWKWRKSWISDIYIKKAVSKNTQWIRKQMVPRCSSKNSWKELRTHADGRLWKIRHLNNVLIFITWLLRIAFLVIWLINKNRVVILRIIPLSALIFHLFILLVSQRSLWPWKLSPLSRSWYNPE